MDIAIASKNPGKIREILEFLSIPGLVVHTFEEYADWPVPTEYGKTFEENARIKAIEILKYTGLPSLADDSGLVVDALDGRPGVHSSHYGGEEGNSQKNIERLLRELEGVPESERKARFVCVLALALSLEEVHFCTGICDGVILMEKRGEGGFGYDPVFMPDGFNLSMAELTVKQKNAISHRGKALSKMRKILEEIVIARKN